MKRVRVSRRQWAVPLEDGFLLGRRTTLLRRVRGGTGLRELLESVVNVLEDRTASVGDICRRLEEHFPPALVADAVRQFISLGILEIEDETGGDGAQGSLPESGPLYRYFAGRSDDPAAGVRAVSRARVVLTGHGRLAALTAGELAGVGVGRVVHYMSAAPAPSYPNDNHHESESSAERARFETVRGELAPEPFRELTGDCDLLITCVDDPVERLRLLPAVNSIHLALERPWLIGCLDGDRVLLGPLFIPHETGCFRCLDLREESHMPHRAEWLAFKRHVQSTTLVNCDDSAPPVARVAGGALAMEALKLLSRVSFPATYQTMISMDLRTFDVEHHMLLRVPFCDACGPHLTRPFRKIWDI